MRFMLALAVALGLSSAGVLTSQALASSCRVTGHVLVNSGGVLVWSAHSPDRSGNEGNAFVCASPSGRTVLLQRSDASATGSQVSNARVSQLRFAGHFVGFFLRTNVEVYSKYLVVLDRVRGRVVVKDLAECDYNDECTGPTMTSYRLAPNGWVAEQWPQLFSSAGGLLATNGRGHYQLDITGISHLKLSRGTLSWTSNPFGASSVKLGPGVITPRLPRKLSACQLLSAGNLAPVLGPSPSASSSAGTCTYTSVAYPGRTLTLELTTGMTPAQMKAAKLTLTNTASYCTLGQWWPADNNFYDLVVARSSLCGNPGTDVRFVIFANGAEVWLDLASPPVSGAAQVAHLSNVAMDRLFGVQKGG